MREIDCPTIRRSPRRAAKLQQILNEPKRQMHEELIRDKKLLLA